MLYNLGMNMKLIIKMIAVSSGTMLITLLPTKSAEAICPICTLAAGAGVGFAQWLGIDDTITGLWIGGLAMSLIMWTVNWLNKKKIFFRFRKIFVTLGYYILIIGPLYFKGIIGHPYNKLWEIDKLLLGIFIGSIAFFLTAKWYVKIKEKNNNHAQFPWQKIAMTLGILLILSIIFYFITRG